MTKPSAIIHWDANGNMTHMTAKGCVVVCIDERAPDDRVYRSIGTVDQAAFNLLISGAAKHPIDALDILAGRLPRKN